MQPPYPRRRRSRFSRRQVVCGVADAELAPVSVDPEVHDATPGDLYNPPVMGTAGLLELRPAQDGERDVTLYVKGFLSRGEEPDHFGSWLACHEELEKSHGWGRQAFGYRWPSGRFGKLTTVLAAAKGAVDVMRVVRNVRRAASMGHLGSIAGEQLGTIVALFVYQYMTASRNARTLADELAAQLRELAVQGQDVRVVAHSLGCRQVIEAAGLLDPAHRPAEIHLCAPAVRENDVADKLSGLARGTTFLYYTDKDRILDLGFTPLARGRALGFAGPSRRRQRLRALDVSESFDFWVHGEYKHRFCRLVP